MDNALIDQPAAAPAPDQAPPRPGESDAPARKPLGWKVDVRSLALIALLLGASGTYRYWRDYQFSTLESQSRDSPFPLKEIPTILGGWRMVDGAEATLDPQIARIAGSTDHIVRTYQDAATGEKATVLVLYGPALLVFAHTPGVCYPSVGYKAMAEPQDVTIPGTEGATGPLFRHELYGRSQGGAVQMSDVFHSFRNGGVWTPEMASRWKQFRYNPGMFKIQVERTVKDSEARDEPAFDILAALVAEIEARIKAAAPAPSH
ncbi:MAG: hypothetical protein BGO49_29955 [Planctomycetales bacterium 71-10]|nr:MAG: hypothetical protein BGO49_29955 [Planctomycetales bacterium 71-10]